MAVTAPVPPPSRPWTAGRTIAVVAASLAALLGVALMLGALALLAGHALLRDDDGFYRSPTELFTTTTPVLTAAGVELWDVGEGAWLAERVDGQARVRVRSTAARPVFAGIAAEADVDRWLSGVAHEEVTDVRFSPFSFDSVRRTGTSSAGVPGDQPFWVASTAGIGTRTLDWKLGEGRWTLVVMQADGAAPVRADVSVGVRTGVVLPIALGALGAGLLLLAASALGVGRALRDRP